MKKAACCAVALMIAAPAHAANLPLRVGWNTELSGPWTFFGSACMNAVQMAEAEVNASAKRIEIIPRDNQTNPAQAAAASRAFDKQDNVDILSGPTNSDTSLAVYGYAEDNAVPFLVPVAAFPRLTRPGTKHTFRMEPDAVGWGYASVKFLNKLKPGATVGIMMSDVAVNRAVLAGFKYQAERDGLKIVSEVIFPSSATDATVQAAQMRAKKPDFIMLSGAGAFDATLTSQLLDIGFKPEQLYHPYALSKQITTWGPRAAGSYYGTFFDPNLDILTERGKKFVDNFRKTKGYAPGYVENFCYTTVHFLNDIVDKAGPGRDGIRKALREADVPEITTNLPVKFDANGARPSYLYMLQLNEITATDFKSKKIDFISFPPETLPVYELAP